MLASCQQPNSSSPCSATGKQDAWTSTVGDCRYPQGGQSGGTHCDGSCNRLDTLTEREDVQACKDACDEIEACHAFDMDFPFSATCWLFTNAAGLHTGVAATGLLASPIRPPAGTGGRRAAAPAARGR